MLMHGMFENAILCCKCKSFCSILGDFGEWYTIYEKKKKRKNKSQIKPGTLPTASSDFRG